MLTYDYKRFDLAVRVFKLTRQFPKEEQFGLTNQVRRSSRSICANIVEGYRKRSYPEEFTRRLSISDGETSETIFWLEMGVACEYITQEECAQLEIQLEEIGRIPGAMMKTPEKLAPRGNAKPAA